MGILQNGFKRGFDQFYNYSGVVPSTPQKEIHDIWSPLRKLWTKYTQLLRRLSYPIQNTFASPNEFFLGALRPLFVPLWTRAANFKGMTERSIKDTARFLGEISDKQIGNNFVFLNLMETHLPYSPPERFVKAFVPYFNETPESQHFMRNFNRNALQWLIPLMEPFSEIESRTLSDMYDAEVAYQDHLLAELISVLNTDYHRENSMVIFLADHGEMLGEHGYMGHGFGVHEELVHVPLFIRLPELGSGKHVKNWVSLTQLFYTVLDYYGFDTLNMPYAEEVDIRCQSLLRAISEDEFTPNHVISEAYCPENSLRIMMNRSPNLIDQYQADKTLRAVYQGVEKMIDIEGSSQHLYNLVEDLNELKPYYDELRITEFSKILDAYLDLATNHRGSSSTQKIKIIDEVMQQRLRDLGYIE